MRENTGEDALKVKLDPPQTSGGGQIWEIIKNRRSVRGFAGRHVSKAELSNLLWAAQGITARQRNFSFRAAPSAGALYPMETYLVVNRVQGLEPGIYRYETESHSLALLKKGDFSDAVARAAYNQETVGAAGMVFIWSAIFARSTWKYKERAYRYIYIEAGHIAQNLALAAAALGLGSCPVGAFDDGEMNNLLGLDGSDESVIYTTALGKPGI
jgi:SagB-type dehydrogenase family enzyme